MVPHPTSYVCDWFHSLGCYWACENGLYRQNPKSHVSDFLFPRLHNLRDRTIATNLTRLIRDHLPPKTPDKIKKSFTSRSIRKGAITELVMHRDIDECRSIVRSGHCMLTKGQESYVDRTNFRLSIPGGMALNDWHDANLRPFPPRLSCLGELACRHAENMLNALYVISHPDFYEKGPLRPVLRLTFATLIMYFPYTEKDLGSRHTVVLSLRNAAIKAQIADIDALDPIDVLRKWSEKIYIDFKERNKAVKEVEHEKEILPAMRSMCNLMTTMQRKMEDMMVLQKDQIHTIRNLQDKLDTISVDNEQMKLEADKMKRKLDFIRTPPSISTYDEETPEQQIMKRQRITNGNAGTHPVASLSSLATVIHSNALAIPCSASKIIPISSADIATNSKSVYYFIQNVTDLLTFFILRKSFIVAG